MGFRDFASQKQGVEVLQRSLERGRLAHAYLFTGAQLETLGALALALAKTLNCQKPEKRGDVNQNKKIKTIIVCGKEVLGHKTGHSLFELHKNGIDNHGRIINSTSPNPILTVTKS